MKLTYKHSGVDAAAPMRRRRPAIRRPSVLAGRRSALFRLAARTVAAFLLLVLAVATFAYFAPTTVLYFGLALVVLSLPVVVPYLIVRGVVAVIDR